MLEHPNVTEINLDYLLSSSQFLLKFLLLSIGWIAHHTVFQQPCLDLGISSNKAMFLGFLIM